VICLENGIVLKVVLASGRGGTVPLVWRVDGGIERGRITL